MSDKKPQENYEPKVETLLDLFRPIPVPEISGNLISVYTDAEAIEDGGLVAITRIDRVTRAVFDFLSEFAPPDAQPPANWPVDLMKWFRTRNRDDKAAAMAIGLISTRGREAKKVYEENIGGGIYQVWAVVDGARGKLNCLAEADPNLGGARKLWLMPNENGGFTLLFPSDY